MEKVLGGIAQLGRVPAALFLIDIGHERIWTWLHDTGLTLEQAAEALGISRRMLIYYRDGEKPIPRAIWLACLGWEVLRPQGRTLPKTIPTAREYAAMHS